MTQYSSLNVKLSNSQLNKLKSAMTNETEVVLKSSSNMIGDDQLDFLHKLLSTNREVANLRKSFADKSSNDIKLSKTKISKMIQSGGFLGRLLGPLLKTGLPPIKNAMKPLAKSVFNPLGLTAAAPEADAKIHNKILGSGYHPSSSALHNNNNAILIISKYEMKDIIKIAKYVEDSSFLPEGVSETAQNEAKE